MFVFAVLAGLAIVLLCVPVWLLALGNGMSRAEHALADRLTTTQRAVESEIERFRYLPGVVGEDARIRALLQGRDRLGEANGYLQAVREMSGADEIYVLNSSGLTLGASNWNEPGSFIGNNYSFRPYFRDAISAGTGRYYAVGVTTGKPGYFLSARVAGPGQPTGVVVAKVDMAPLEVAWAKAGDLTGIADDAGMVFLTGHAAWKYRPLNALSPQAVTAISAERRYDGINVAGLEPIVARGIATGDPIVVDDPDGALLAAATGIEPDGWTLFSALPLRPVYDEARLVTGVAALTGLLVSAISMFFWQRRQITRMKLEQNVVLERRVRQRTEALHHEIEERKRTESELRSAQESLIHAAKLAALGRMSAAIVHEVTQPLSAMENTLAAAGLHAEKKAMPEIKRNLTAARDLVRRMQRMVKHLKTFSSRKEAARPEAVDLDPVMEAAVEIVMPRARELGVALEVEPARIPPVAGSPLRLEQVFINLILNAVDASAGDGTPRVSIRMELQGGRVAVVIRDTGPGIPEEIRERMFEPFFTTKTTGGGLGLGLSITTTILEEFGGELSFSRAEGGGTLTRVSLPTFAGALQIEQAVLS